MRMYFLTLPALLLLLAAHAAVVSAAVFNVSADSASVKWTGRVYRPGDGSVMGDWAGVSASVCVNHSQLTYVRANIRDVCAGGNKWDVFMTAEGVRQQLVATFFSSPIQSEYVLFAARGQLSFWGATACFTLSKAVEARFTQCSGGAGDGNLTDASLAVISFDSDAPFLSAPPASTRGMEIIGDSITGGDLVYCPTGSENNSLWADDWGVTYGALLCHAFDADCNTVSWGGMGMAANDVPTWTWPVFPDVYSWRFAWQGSVQGQGATPVHPWNPAEFIPNAVLINLGTNDAAGGRFHNPTFTATYVATYTQFVRNVTAAYAQASGGSANVTFFLGFGPMTQVYAPAVLSVISAVTGEGILAVPINYTLAEGCHCGHPSASDHALMAGIAQPIIAKTMGW